MAAKGLGKPPLVKARQHGLRARLIEDGLHIRSMEIPQRNRSLTVQTTRDNRAVAEHTDLIAKPIAGASLAVIGCVDERRPIKALAPFQIKAIADLIAVMMRDPFLGKCLMKRRQNGIVVRMVRLLPAFAVQIP